MGLTKLAAKLPDDADLNGLDHWTKHLKEHPFEQLVVVAYVDTQKLITDYEKGQIHPVIQVQAIEVIDTALDCPAHIRHAFDAARDRRLNRPPLFEEGPQRDGDTTVEQVRELEAGVIDVEVVEDGDDD